MFHVKFQGAGAGLCINDEEDAGQKLNHATMHETASEIPTARIESIGRARAVYQIQPLNDRRWAKFVTTNAQASLFHSPMAGRAPPNIWIRTYCVYNRSSWR